MDWQILKDKIYYLDGSWRDIYVHNTTTEDDIAPNEINSLADHNKLMDYMTRLSKVLNKTVVLTPENQSDFVLISVYKDEIKINLY